MHAGRWLYNGGLFTYEFTAFRMGESIRSLTITNYIYNTQVHINISVLNRKFKLKFKIFSKFYIKL